MNQAKAKILQVREGESFDDAYANNQVEAHEQAIELYEKAAASEDAELSAWAKEVLPKLKHHLEMARDLRADSSTYSSSAECPVGAAPKRVCSSVTGDPNEKSHQRSATLIGSVSTQRLRRRRAPQMLALRVGRPKSIRSCLTLVLHCCNPVRLSLR